MLTEPGKGVLYASHSNVQVPQTPKMVVPTYSIIASISITSNYDASGFC